MDDLETVDKTVDGIKTITEVVTFNIKNYETSDGTVFEDIAEANIWQRWLNTIWARESDLKEFGKELYNFFIYKK